jgi:hypothetical protein
MIRVDKLAVSVFFSKFKYIKLADVSLVWVNLQKFSSFLKKCSDDELENWDRIDLLS